MATLDRLVQKGELCYCFDRVFVFSCSQIRKAVTSRTRGATSEAATEIKTKTTTELGTRGFRSLPPELVFIP